MEKYSLSLREQTFEVFYEEGLKIVDYDLENERLAYKLSNLPLSPQIMILSVLEEEVKNQGNEALKAIVAKLKKETNGATSRLSKRSSPTLIAYKVSLHELRDYYLHKAPQLMHTSSITLDYMAKSKPISYAPLSQIVKHPNLSHATKSDFARSPLYWLRRGIARRGDITLDLFEVLSQDTVPLVRNAIARNPYTPQDILLKLALDSNATVREGVLNNSSTPLECVAILSQDPIARVRRGRANRKDNTSASIAAAQSEVKTVRIRYASSRSLEGKILSLMVKDQSIDVRARLARNPNLFESDLFTLAHDAKIEVRKAVAASRNITPGIIEHLLKDSSSSVHYALCHNPRLSDSEITKLYSQVIHGPITMALHPTSVRTRKVMQQLIAKKLQPHLVTSPRYRGLG